MATFEELKERALDLAQAGMAKAKELTDIAKLNLANTSEEENIRKAYVEIGKLYYAERGMAPEAAYVSLCEKISEAKKKIEENREKIAELKVADAVPAGGDAVGTDVPPEETIHPEE